MDCYLGVDLGSVSTNLVLINEDNQVLESVYLRTGGAPITALQQGVQMLHERYGDNLNIKACGVTGSGRRLADAVLGADIAKNEITAHAKGSIFELPNVRTIFEIGGQDSKIIFLEDGMVTDFAMNTVCAAGTGSFLDRQASRMGVAIEDFGKYAERAVASVRIAGRCAVFAESDMIHKQQAGHSREDIVKGLCEALVRNYLSNLAKNKRIFEPILFQGGVAANVGIKKAFEEILNKRIYVPRYYHVMGALGMALFSKEQATKQHFRTRFLGIQCKDFYYTTSNFACDACPNSCEVLSISCNNEVVARWGDRCGRWNVDKEVVNL